MEWNKKKFNRLAIDVTWPPNDWVALNDTIDEFGASDHHHQTHTFTLYTVIGLLIVLIFSLCLPFSFILLDSISLMLWKHLYVDLANSSVLHPHSKWQRQYVFSKQHFDVEVWRYVEQMITFWWNNRRFFF